MPVLYGVFLYMGASSLRGIQVSSDSACWYLIWRTNREKRLDEFLNGLRVCACAVLWPYKAVQHAGQTSARLHLPSSRPTEEGAPLHHHPAQLLGPALGHQDLQGCHSLPHDGNSSVFMYSLYTFVLTAYDWLISVCFRCIRSWLWCSFVSCWTSSSPRENWAGWMTWCQSGRRRNWRMHKKRCNNRLQHRPTLNDFSSKLLLQSFRFPLSSFSSGGAQYYCRGRRHCTGASGGKLQVNHFDL